LSASSAHPSGFLGVVLAGGASTRYGSPKWRASVGGASMRERATAALAPHVLRVVTVGHDALLAGPGMDVRPDLVPGLGPLGGIHTALVWATELSLDGAFVLACDLPLVSEAVVGALVGAWEGEDAVVPLGGSGPEPLCALYGLGLLGRVAAAIAEGERSPARFLEREEGAVRWVRSERLPRAAGGVDPFLNVNTPGERDRAEGALGAGAPGLRRDGE
jgi:molybdenum cofactor guanylyltransferase